MIGWYCGDHSKKKDTLKVGGYRKVGGLFFSIVGDTLGNKGRTKDTKYIIKENISMLM